MKRISWSNSPNCSQDKDVSSILISSSPSSAEEKIEYDERFQPLLVNGTEEVEEEDEELGGGYGQSSLGEKKRRLSADQVKALEKNFEVENKLDPERKVRLAQDLGLQPRQVAVWFQNRRARWKTKLLERDYGSLKDQYNALKLDCDALRHDKELLTAEIRELKAKLGTSGLASTTSELEKKLAVEEERPAMIYRDGSSDSDSSAVFNDETSPYSGVLLGQQQHCLMGFKSHCSFFLFQNTEVHDEKGYLEEGLLGGQELCSNLFSEEQAPSLSWYCSQGWE